jgi:transcriptional regulator with XRE-family HTH domain
VPGLRREEVAVLAGVSTEWYVRLEKGHISGVSDEVLHAVARALQLDEAERVHLFDLARAAKPSRSTRRRTQQTVRPSVLRILESMTGTPAFVRNRRLDVLAINPLGRALYSTAFDDPARPANLARFCFLDPQSRDFYPDWDDVAHVTVALLRTEAGRDPYNRELTGLVGELATRSEEFRIGWAAHDVRLHQRRTRLTVRGRAEAARQLGRHRHPAREHRHRPARSLADHPPKEAKRGIRPGASPAFLTATEELPAPAAALLTGRARPAGALAQEHPPDPQS